MKHLFILTLAAALISSCDSGESTNAGPVCSKDVQSRWIAEEANFLLNMSNLAFDETEAYQVSFESGAACTFDIKVTGAACDGIIQGSSALYNGEGEGDPGCAMFNDTFTYTIRGDSMELCDSDDACDFYE